MDFKFDFFAILDRVDFRLKKEIETLGKRERVQSGTIIFNQGAISSGVYLVTSGVVEVVTFSPDGVQTSILAHFARGEFFGESGVLGAQKRSATVRACEACELIKFESSDFLRMIETYPAFGLYISRSLARRLHDTTLRSAESAYSLVLSGHLRYFDLLTIFQAISGARHNGELRLSDYGQNLIGSFFFRQGRVQYAKYAHLEGLEAVWQGFIQSATEGNFAFELMEHPQQLFHSDNEIRLDASTLLMTGVSKRDSFQSLPENFRKMQGRLEMVPVAEADKGVTGTVALRLLELISRRPQPLLTLWRRLNFSEITFLEAVQELIRLKAAEVRDEREYVQTKDLSTLVRPKSGT